MHDAFLTEKTKQFYTDALNHARSCKDEFWDLDSGLDGYLDLINSSSNIATMYTKYGESSFEGGLVSYVIICYTKNVEKTVLEDIPQELKKLLSHIPNRNLSVLPNAPKIEAKEDATNPCLKYLRKPEYWNINNVRFQLIGELRENHDTFWNSISTRLSRL